MKKNNVNKFQGGKKSVSNTSWSSLLNYYRRGFLSLYTLSLVPEQPNSIYTRNNQTSYVVPTCRRDQGTSRTASRDENTGNARFYICVHTRENLYKTTTKYIIVVLPVRICVFAAGNTKSFLRRLLFIYYFSFTDLVSHIIYVIYNTITDAPH